MASDKMFDEITIGDVYRRRDDRLVFVYGYNPIYNTYLCILQDSGEIYSVHFDGTYSSGINHNDLVERIK